MSKSEMGVLILCCLAVAYALFQNSRSPFNDEFFTSETLEIHILNNDFSKLKAKRKEALKEGVLRKGPRDYVDAQLKFQGKTLLSKLRLKGDLPDHFKDENRWSLRVKLDKSETIFGMNRFSIQKPETRGGVNEARLFQHLRDEGVLTPNYFFMNVIVNGESWGEMAIEEHFSHELLTSQDRELGVILAFDESKMWESSERRISLEEFPIKLFRSKHVNKKTELVSQAAIAIKNLKAHLEGNFSFDKVFDVRKYAVFHAVTNLWQGAHALGLHNLRFYFNPKTKKIEPIAYDAMANQNPDFLKSQRFTEFPRVLESKEFLSKYREALVEIQEHGRLSEYQKERISYLIENIPQ